MKENEPLPLFKKEKTASSISMEIFPNPFEESTTIFLHLEKEKEVELGIYDSTGKLISNIIDKVHFESGDYQYIVNRQNKQTGVFYSILRTSDESIIQKIILIR